MLYELYLKYIKKGYYPKDEVCDHILWWLKFLGNCQYCRKENWSEIKRKIELKKPIKIKQVKKIFLNRFYTYTIPNYVKKILITKEVSSDDERVITRILKAFELLNKLDDNTECFLGDNLKGLGWIGIRADIYYFSLVDHIPSWEVDNDLFRLFIDGILYFWKYKGKTFFAYKIQNDLIRNLFLPFSLLLIEGKKFNYKFDYFVSPNELIAIDFEKIKKALPNKN